LAVFTLLLAGCASPTGSSSASSPAQQYLDFALKACDQTERQIPEMTRVAEIVAERHIAGGVIGVLWEEICYGGQGLGEELVGRSGQIMHIGFARCWKKERTDEEREREVIPVLFQ
jgi:hypothetical protein